MISSIWFLLFSVGCFWLLKRNTTRDFTHPALLYGLWTIKWAGMILFTAWYTYSGENLMRADVYKYYHDANVLHQLLPKKCNVWLGILSGLNTDSEEAFVILNQTEFYFHGDNHWTNDDRLMIRINQVIRLFSIGNIYIHSLVFLVFGFYCGLYFYRRWQKKSGIPNWLLYLLILGLPSVIFWCGGALKETLLLGSLYLLFGSILPHPENKKRNGGVFLLAVILLFMIRPVLLAVWIPAIVFTGWMSMKREFKLVALITAILLIGCIIIKLPEISGLMINKRNELLHQAMNSQSGSLADETFRNPDNVSLLKLLPESIVLGLSAPLYPRVSGGIAGLLFGLEILFLLSICFCLTPRKRVDTNTRRLAQIWVSGSLLYLVIVGLTSPVAGAVIRYRSLILPWLMIGIAELFVLRFFIYDGIISLLSRINANGRFFRIKME